MDFSEPDTAERIELLLEEIRDMLAELLEDRIEFVSDFESDEMH